MSDRLTLPQGWSAWPQHRKEALRQTLRMTRFRRVYTHDPEAFLHDCFRWDDLPEDGPTPYQVEILTDVYRYGREAVRGPHGIGKTTIAAFFLLHFSMTRDGVADWKMPTTASAWRQLKEFLWPEVHKWVRYIDWSKIGRDPFDEPRELQDMALRLATGSAFAVASDQPSTIEGAHADSLAYLYDEAKTIQTETFEASEGAFSGAGADVIGREAYALGLSTPGEPQGPFYLIHKRDPRYSEWHPRHVTLEEAVSAGRISNEWAITKVAQWGKTAAITQNRVFGEFAASEEHAVIPLAWIEAAVDRWRALQVQTVEGDWRIPPELIGSEAYPWTCASCDVADQGEDETVIGLRYGHLITDIRRIPFNPDPMETAGHVLGVLRPRGGLAVVDGIGIGSGVVSRLREQGQSVDSFIASQGSDRVDRTGEFGFQNRRAEAWWSLREQLDPTQPGGSRIALPPDDQMIGDLTAPRYKTLSEGRIQIESKDDIRKRINRSPDAGDMVVQAFNVRNVQVETYSAANVQL